MNAAHALLQSSRIPRHVVIRHHPTELQVDPFTSRIRANHDARATLFDRPLKKRDLLAAREIIHTAMDARHLASKPQPVKPALEVSQRVAMFGEHEQLL